MKTFDIDFTDQLSEQQVRYLLKAELERNKLLIKQNKFALFRYEVEEDTMILLFHSPDGETQHLAFEHYTQQAPALYFDEKEHQRIAEAVLKIVNDPEYPKIGAQDFYYKDGTGVCIEYTSLFDDNGKVISIVGQHVDLYQTHDRMVATIHLLNEQIAMTDAVRQSYETMLMIDLSDYSYKILQSTPEVRAASQLAPSVLQLAALFCKYYVDPTYQEDFMAFVNEGTISDRLMGNRYLAFEYMTKNIGWCRARIMPAEIGSNGEVLKAIFSTETAANHQEELKVLRVAASRDGLTGLLNRVTGEEAIKQALGQHQEAVYAILDCDFFKNINDKLGHPTGDQVLIGVANALVKTFPNEYVMRLGGDEFVVFIQSPEQVARIKLQGKTAFTTPLREQLALIDIPQLKGKKPSLSCGAVLVPSHTQLSLTDIYTLADQKLYEAKASHNGAMALAVVEE